MRAPHDGLETQNSGYTGHTAAMLQWLFNFLMRKNLATSRCGVMIQLPY